MRGHPPAASSSRRLLAALVAVVILGGVPSLVAAADEGLQEAREELQQTKERIRARAAKLRDLQRDLNRLATRIARREAEIRWTTARMWKLRRAMQPLEDRAEQLRALLDERTREAYMTGMGTNILYLLTATSAADLASRLSFLEELNRRDAALVRGVERVQERLAGARETLARMRAMRELALQQLAANRRELRRKLAESRDLFAFLKERKHEVLHEISAIRPFAVCPVDGPHAIADDFGIRVHHPKEWGGTHIHQGNDISAPLGTPIVAPFDGLAVANPNKIGGLAVEVYGEFGFVYNAHLSRYGQLGEVEKGDVIGYVGATGNAGGPHDHFEWHPANGDAVDPYEFLLMVC